MEENLSQEQSKWLLKTYTQELTFTRKMTEKGIKKEAKDRD